MPCQLTHPNMESKRNLGESKQRKRQAEQTARPVKSLGIAVVGTELMLFQAA